MASNSAQSDAAPAWKRRTPCEHSGPKDPLGGRCVDCFFAGTTQVRRENQWCSSCKKEGHSAWYCAAGEVEVRS